MPVDLASNFWAAVEDCLVQVHGFERDTAAKEVTSLRRRLAQDTDPDADEPSFDDMIYHAHPSHIARNLAGREFPEEHRFSDANPLRQIEQSST